MKKTTTHWISALATVLGLSACSSDPGRPEGPPPVPGCRSLSDYAHVTSVLLTPGRARRAVLADGIVYVADGVAGLSAVDDDGVRSTLPGISGDAFDVEVIEGARLAVAWGEDGVAVVDVTDPDLPIVVGRVSAPGSAVDVFVSGSLVYAADDEVGLLIVDISDASNPRVLGVENTPGVAAGVVASGPLAYVADRQLGVRVANVEDPTAPFLIRSIATPGIAHAVALGHGFLYVADDLGGLHVVDVRIPGSETIVHTEGAGSSTRDVSLDGTVLYAAQRFNGIALYDVTLPSQPRAAVRFGALELSEGVSAREGGAVACDPGVGVRVIDATLPMAAPVIDRDAPPGADLLAVAARESLVVAADSTFGIRTWVAGPGGLVSQGMLALGGGAHRILVDGNRGFVARASVAVEVIDLSSAANPVWLGRIPFSSATTGMAVDGNRLYLSRGSAALLEVDLTGAVQPRGKPLNAQFSSDVAVTATHVYVPVVSSQVYIVSRSFFDGPLGGYPVGGLPGRIAMGRGDAGLGVPLETDFAFVALRSSPRGPGVVALNLFDAMRPTEAAFIATAAPPQALAVDDGVMYVGLGNGGVEVYEVSDLDAVTRLGFYPAQQWVSDVAASTGLVFAADGQAGLFVASPELCD